MKNYLYHFEFFSGEYESYFYRKTKASDQKEAIVQIVAYFINLSEEEAEDYIKERLNDDFEYDEDDEFVENKILKKDWTVELFWEKIDTRFMGINEFVGYTLIWIKEVNFDLDRIT